MPEAFTITVIVPTCDRPGRLPGALASVLAQTRAPDEILVVDDGAVPVEVGALPAGVVLLRTRGRQGASFARNLGANQALGSHLAFLDDDDRWEPDHLAEAEALARAGGDDLVLTAFAKVRESPVGEQAVPEKVPPERLAPEDFFVRNPGLRGSNLFVRRTLFLDLGGFDLDLPSHNDLDLGIRLASVPGLRYRRNPRPRVRFHVHPDVRLSTPGSPANLAGMRALLARHGTRMGPERVSAFRARCLALFGVDPGAERQP